MNKKIIIGIIGMLFIFNLQFIFPAETGFIGEGGGIEIIQPELTIDYRENNTGYIRHANGTITDIYTRLTFKKNYFYFDFLNNHSFNQNQIVSNNYSNYFFNNYQNQIGGLDLGLEISYN